LEQAGLAIAAAYAPGEYWFSSHGLKVVDLNAKLYDMKVRVDGDQKGGAYRAVSNAVGSEVIESEVSVGALWASLPDLTFAPLPGDHPGVIQVIPNMPHEPWTGNSVGISFNSPFTPTNAEIYLDLRHTPDAATDEWLKEVLGPYPGTRDSVLYRKKGPRRKCRGSRYRLTRSQDSLASLFREKPDEGRGSKFLRFLRSRLPL
jgi:hypothetical protein